MPRQHASWPAPIQRFNDLTIYCGAYRIKIPTPNAATRGLQHRSVAVGPQTVRMLLGGLIHPRSSQPEWLLEVAPQLRSRQVLAPAYLSRALYPPGFIICNVGPHACLVENLEICARGPAGATCNETERQFGPTKIGRHTCAGGRSCRLGEQRQQGKHGGLQSSLSSSSLQRSRQSRTNAATRAGGRW